MLSQEVAHKYGAALFMSTKEKRQLESTYEQLKGLREVIVADRTLLGFLSAPQVLENTKERVVRDIFGPRVDRLLVEFLVVLVHKNRIHFLREIIDEFEELYEDEKGIGRATVVTAVPMTDSERDSVVQKLETHSGKSILLQERVDKSIIGGMIAMYDGEIIDGSVRHSLTVLRDQLSRLRVY